MLGLKKALFLARENDPPEAMVLSQLALSASDTADTQKSSGNKGVTPGDIGRGLKSAEQDINLDDFPPKTNAHEVKRVRKAVPRSPSSLRSCSVPDSDKPLRSTSGGDNSLRLNLNEFDSIRLC
jgi:hypothetical protein